MTGKVVEIPVSPRRDEATQADEAWVHDAWAPRNGGDDRSSAPRSRLDESRHRRLRVAAANQGLHHVGARARAWIDERPVRSEGA